MFGSSDIPSQIVILTGERRLDEQLPSPFRHGLFGSRVSAELLDTRQLGRYNVNEIPGSS